MNEFTETAVRLIDKPGGKDNISALTHCATRIRIALKNNGKTDKSAIEKLIVQKDYFL